MGLFSTRPKTTLFDVIDIDLTDLPDDTFTTESETNAAGDEIYNHYSYYSECELLSLFSELRVVTFADSNGKNFIFTCPDDEQFAKADLSSLINDIYSVYGVDDSGEGKFKRDDWEQISDEGFWMGRRWTDDRFSVACAIDYAEEDGLSFTIWTK